MKHEMNVKQDMDMRVCCTPAMLSEEAVRGAACIVIDVLRMTTVAVTALEHGAAGVLAVGEVEAARRIAGEQGALLGGERNALPIAGFDFDNSPLAYTRARVEGRRIVMTTSNGTRAILAAQGARRLLLGAFRNAGAVAERVRAEKRVVIVCAGTLGDFTLEDALAAGAICSRLRSLGAALRANDMAMAAMRLYERAKGDLRLSLADTAHTRRLLSLGMEADVAYCLAEDVARSVPERGNDGWFG